MGCGGTIYQKYGVKIFSIYIWHIREDVQEHLCTDILSHC